MVVEEGHQRGAVAVGKGYGQVPRFGTKEPEGNKYPDLTFFLPFSLPATPPIDKPNGKLGGKNAH